MITSKFPSVVDGDGWLASMEITVVRSARPKQISFHWEATVANTYLMQMLWSKSICRPSKGSADSTDRRPIKLSDSNRTETAERGCGFVRKRGKSELKKGDDLIENHDEIQASQCSVAVNILRRSRCNVSGRMCRHTVRCLWSRSIIDRILHGI